MDNTHTEEYYLQEIEKRLTDIYNSPPVNIPNRAAWYVLDGNTCKVYACAPSSHAPSDPNSHIEIIAKRLSMFADFDPTRGVDFLYVGNTVWYAVLCGSAWTRDSVQQLNSLLQPENGEKMFAILLNDLVSDPS